MPAKKKLTRAQERAFQVAAKNRTKDRTLWGRRYHFYGSTDSKARVRTQVKGRYEHVHFVKMPAIIRKVDPESAKYTIFVSGKIRRKR